MFIQVLRGKVTDPQRVHDALDQWSRELAPGATGWRGTTAGCTEDGEFVATVRFDSQADAQRNSRRPEQDAWFRRVSSSFEGDVIFHDCTEVDMLPGGEAERGGFVQVLEGSFRDPARARELSREMQHIQDYRPDILGWTVAMHEDGEHYTQTVYFSSEAEAREGERKEPPPKMQQMFSELDQLGSRPQFLDIKQPWLYSPA